MLAAAVPFRIPPGWLPGGASLVLFSSLAAAGAALCLLAARKPEPGRVAGAVAALTAAMYLGASTLLAPGDIDADLIGAGKTLFLEGLSLIHI